MHFTFHKFVLKVSKQKFHAMKMWYQLVIKDTLDLSTRNELEYIDLLDDGKKVKCY